MHIHFQLQKCLHYLTTSALSIARMNLHVIPLENVQPISFYFLSCFFIFLLYKAQHCSPGAGLQVVDCKRWDWVCHRSLEARIFSAENIFKSLFQFWGSNTSCSQRIFVSLHILYITLVVIFKKIKKLLLFDFKIIFKKSKSTFYYLFKNPQNTLNFAHPPGRRPRKIICGANEISWPPVWYFQHQFQFSMCYPKGAHLITHC